MFLQRTHQKRIKHILKKTWRHGKRKQIWQEKNQVDTNTTIKYLYSDESDCSNRHLVTHFNSDLLIMSPNSILFKRYKKQQMAEVNPHDFDVLFPTMLISLVDLCITIQCTETKQCMVFRPPNWTYIAPCSELNDMRWKETQNNTPHWAGRVARRCDEAISLSPMKEHYIHKLICLLKVSPGLLC
jgi:hypothetical protein